MLFSLLLILRILAPEAGPVRETETFRLYKFQQPIGIERSIRARRPDGTTEIRTTFSFTDRNTTVPLVGDADARPGRVGRRATRRGARPPASRSSTIGSRSKAARSRSSGTARSRRCARRRALLRRGRVRAGRRRREQLWRYWAAHGRPAALPVFPSGTVSFERRGKDEVTDDDGKPASLDRYSLSGLGVGPGDGLDRFGRPPRGAQGGGRRVRSLRGDAVGLLRRARRARRQRRGGRPRRPRARSRGRPLAGSRGERARSPSSARR